MQQGIKIEGVKQTYDSLKELGRKTKGSILRRVHRKAPLPVKRDLTNAISRRGYKNKIRPSDVMMINDRYNLSGVLVSISSKAYPVSWIEKGTNERFAKKWRGRPLSKKAARGKVKAKPFIVPAHDANEGHIRRTFERDYDELITKSIISQNRLVKRKLSKR